MSLGRKKTRRLREYYNFRANLFDAIIQGRKLKVLYWRPHSSHSPVPIAIHDLTGKIESLAWTTIRPRNTTANLTPEDVLWFHNSHRMVSGPKYYEEVPPEEMASIVRQYFMVYLHVKASLLDAIESGELTPDNLTTRIKYHVS